MESGRYNSASEVVREALRLLDEHNQARALQIAGFNRELGRRLESLDHGKHVFSRGYPRPAQAQIRAAPECQAVMPYIGLVADSIGE